MNVLVVGAGAVGAVFAHHLTKSGAEVTFLVKPKHADETTRGFQLYPLHDSAARNAGVAFTPRRVLTDVEQVKGARWDFVVLAISSPALHAEGTLDALAAAAPAACFVAIQPGTDDHAFVAARVPPDRLVWGAFSAMSFATSQLELAVPKPGFAYFVPPGPGLPFSGARAREVASALSKGGLRAKTVESAPAFIAFGDALLMMSVVPLELSGWRLRDFFADRQLLEQAVRGIGEMSSIAERHFGMKRPALNRFMRPMLLRLLLTVLRKTSPFDLERFFATHYTKVAAQTEAELETLLALASKHGIDAPAITRMRAALLEARAARRRAAATR